MLLNLGLFNYAFLDPLVLEQRGRVEWLWILRGGSCGRKWPCEVQWYLQTYELNTSFEEQCSREKTLEYINSDGRPFYI